jgi:hypothetical protein
MYTLGDTAVFQRVFLATVPEAQGVIDAAIAEVELLAGDAPVADEAGVDAELWEYVAPEIHAEAWGKTASQAVIFGQGALSARSEKTLRSLSSVRAADTRWA